MAQYAKFMLVFFMKWPFQTKQRMFSLSFGTFSPSHPLIQPFAFTFPSSFGSRQYWLSIAILQTSFGSPSRFSTEFFEHVSVVCSFRLFLQDVLHDQKSCMIGKDLSKDSEIKSRHEDYMRNERRLRCLPWRK